MSAPTFATDLRAALAQLWQVLAPQRYRLLADSAGASSAAALALLQAEAALGLAAALRLIAVAMALFIITASLWLMGVAALAGLVYWLTQSLAAALTVSFLVQLLAAFALLRWARVLRQHLHFSRSRAHWVWPVASTPADPQFNHEES